MMSNFRRKQSQVFWKHMETQDLGIPRVTNVFGASDVAKGREGFENRGASGTDAPQVLSPLGAEEDEEEEEEEEEEDKHVLEEPDRERSASPRSYVGHRSQDSGFSDSERSEESGVDAYASRVERLRRARTRKSRRRREPEEVETDEKISLESPSRRLETLWTTADRNPHPRHTSTPKSSQIRRKVSASQPRAPRRRARNLQEDIKAFDRDSDDEDDEEVRVPRMIGVSMEDGECLGDFLYASEPPEDVFEVQDVVNYSQSAQRLQRSRRSTTENINGQLASVRYWLGIIALETEAECGSTLQSKALPRNRNYSGTNASNNVQNTTDSTLLTASATAAATKLLTRVDQFHKNYQSAIEELSRPSNSRTERGLIQSVEEEAFLLLSELGSPPPQRVRNLSNSKDVIRQLKDLKFEVDRAVDTRLDFFIERIVRGLEEAPREEGTAARGALAALTVLGLGPGGPIGGRSIARCSGVRALLTALLSIRGQSSGSRDSRAACLRALASVCCCAEAIEQLVSNGGPEILADLLSSEAAPEVEKMEATALIVQITAPWTNAFGLPHLEPFSEEIVPSLTFLVENTECSQTLLLAAAALNNLASSQEFVGPIIARKTVAALLKSVKRSGGGSIWLMEQVAALIGELARSPEAHSHLAEARASVALVCFLRMRPPGLESAYRRLEATASAALARLCVDREVAQQVVDVGGVTCVIPYQNNEDRQGTTKPNSRYTRSLRIACKKANEQIDAAKASGRGCTLDL